MLKHFIPGITLSGFFHCFLRLDKQFEQYKHGGVRNGRLKTVMQCPPAVYSKYCYSAKQSNCN